MENVQQEQQKSQPNLIDFLEAELLSKKFINKPIDREILSKVDVVGFDVDHTLSLYNTENLIELLYACFSRYLVEHLNYPKDILVYSSEEGVNKLEQESNFKFQQDFVNKYSSTEVVVDVQHGNVINISENRFVLKAFHGTDELKEEDLEKFYGAEKKFSEINFECKSGSNYHMVMGNFEFHVIPLFLIAVHLYDNGEMQHLERIKDYRTIYNDIIEALIFNYNLYDSKNKIIKKMSECGYFFPELIKNPKKYLHDFSSKEVLQHFKSKGLNVFFATNSFYEYGDFILRNSLGDDYLDYFDFGVFYCQKPGFFSKDNNSETFFIDGSSDENKILPGITYTSLSDEETFNKILKEKQLLGGSYKIIEEYYKKLLKKDDLKFIYVGDNFFSDCYHSAQLENWQSIGVNEHIATGFIGNNPVDFKRIWEIENQLGINANQNESVFFTKLYRENTLFTISNVDTLKYLK